MLGILETSVQRSNRIKLAYHSVREFASLEKHILNLLAFKDDAMGGGNSVRGPDPEQTIEGRGQANTA